MSNTSNTYSEQIFFHYILGNQVFLNIAKSEFFSNQVLRDLFDIAKEHSLKYKESPSKDQLFEILKLKALSEKYNDDILTSLYATKELITNGTYGKDWCDENTKAWIELRNLDYVMRKSIAYMKTSNVNVENASSLVEKVRHMISTETSFDFNFDLGSDFFDAASHMQTRLARKSSGYDYIDLVSKGGYSAGSLIAFLGGAKSGKCCCGDTFINIRNKKTGEIKKIKYEEFYYKICEEKYVTSNNILSENEIIYKNNIINKTNIYSVEWQMYRYNLTINDAYDRVNNLKNINTMSCEW